MKSTVCELECELHRARQRIAEAQNLKEYDAAKAQVMYLKRVLDGYTVSPYRRHKVHFE